MRSQNEILESECKDLSNIVSLVWNHRHRKRKREGRCKSLEIIRKENSKTE